jgi:hypothetical protein
MIKLSKEREIEPYLSVHSDGADEGASFRQAKVSSFLTLNVDDRSISDLLVRLPIQGDTDRKAGRTVVPNDLNAADGLAARPLSNGLKALFSQSSVAQSDCF